MTKIIAHRGANRHAPQNTIPAFRLAKELGCDGFENDVHFTKDGKIVVCHNYEVDKTSNGTGKISEMTFDELRALDFGSYFSTDFKDTRIPTLDEFYEVAQGLEMINVEIKKPLDGNLNIVEATIEHAKQWKLFDQLIISSFDPRCLVRAKEIEPTCKTGLLYDMTSPDIEIINADPVAYAKKLRCDAIHPLMLMVDEDLVNSCHKSGIKVHPWTVDSEEAIIALADMGCDALITDVCDEARRILEEHAKGSI